MKVKNHPYMNTVLRTIFSLFIATFLLVCNGNRLSAQIEITGQNTAGELVNALLDKGIEVSNIELNCPGSSFGIFTAEENVGIGLTEGIVLTTGSINDIPGPNQDGGISFTSNGGSDPFLDALLAETGVSSMDACVLQIDLVPCGDILSFNYVFGSDEYNEFACSNFNDIFAFLISGPNPEGGDYVNENIALIPGSTLPVAINTVNSGIPGTNGTSDNCVLDFADLFVSNDNNEFDMQYDGFTVPLTAFASVVAGETYSLYLAIADAQDTSWDSGVFIEAGSLNAQFIEFVLEPSVEINGVDNLVEGCINGTVNFETTAPVTEDLVIEYTLSGSAENGVDYGTENGDPLGGMVLIPTGSTTGTVDITVFTDGVTEGVEDIIISIMNQADCSGLPLSVAWAIQDEITLDACCSSQIMVGESVQLGVSGGAGNYVWSPDDGSIDDINSATPTVSPTQTTTYTVTSTAAGCELLGSVTVSVGGCESSAGTVSGGGMACVGSTVSATVSGQSLDADDVLTYALHNSPIGSPASPNFELFALSSDGVFTNEGLIPFNQPIYISSVVGNNNGGIPDLMDPCLSISAPVEVIFLAPIVINVQEICDSDTGELNAEISINGGMPAFVNGGQYNLTGTSLVGVTVEYATSTSVSLGVITGQSFTFNATDGFGCSGTFTSGLVECIKTAVELVEFDGVPEAKANHVYWSTATETDNDYFILQRSFDGSSFDDIAQLDGAGNSETASHYSFFDYEAREGGNFYRLKSVEFSGLTDWSNVILVNRESEESNDSFEVFPVPTQDNLYIQLAGEATVTGQISVVDVSGKYILSRAAEAAEGQLKLNVSSLAPGLYLFVWENSNGREVARFVKE